MYGPLSSGKVLVQFYGWNIADTIETRQLNGNELEETLIFNFG